MLIKPKTEFLFDKKKKKKEISVFSFFLTQTGEKKICLKEKAKTLRFQNKQNV